MLAPLVLFLGLAARYVPDGAPDGAPQRGDARAVEAASPAPVPALDVPVALDRGHLILDVAVNGAGPWPFVLDTGARISTIDGSIAAELGLETRGRLSIAGAGEGAVTATEVRGVTLGVGAWTSAPTAPQVMDLVGFQEGAGEIAFWGILGMDAFHGHVLDLDFPAGRVRVHRPDDLRLSEEPDWLPVRRASFLAVRAEIELDGVDPVEGWFAIDTGAGHGVIVSMPFAARTGIEAATRDLPVERIGRGLGGDLYHRVGELQWLRLGALEREAVPFQVADDTAGFFSFDDYAGLIGTEVWSSYRCLLDLDRVALALVEPAH